jgi:hypothetical protein
MLTLILATMLSGGAGQWPGMEAGAAQAQEEETGTMRITIRIGDEAMTATLEDNESSRDFLSLLPLELVLEDYAATEKISYLPRRLSTKDAPEGIDPSAGDITYYAPWGNVAIFHKDFGYSRGLIKLGTLDSGIEILRRPGQVNATIERLEETH